MSFVGYALVSKARAGKITPQPYFLTDWCCTTAAGNKAQFLYCDAVSLPVPRIVEVIGYRFKLTQSRVTYKYMYIVVATFPQPYLSGFYLLLILVSACSTRILSQSSNSS
jgi:hypothetical protein